MIVDSVEIWSWVMVLTSHHTPALYMLTRPGKRIPLPDQAGGLVPVGGDGRPLCGTHEIERLSKTRFELSESL